MSNFKSLILKVNSWSDFKIALKPLSKLEKGNAFEQLTKYYLLSNPVYKDKLKSVWLQKEIPPSVSKKLNLPTNDQGIDLIAENNDGTFWAIQCKYLQDEEQRLSHRAISTFTSLSKLTAKNISYCLVATTADDYAKLYKGNNYIGFVNADEWNKLNKEFFTNVRTALTGKEIKYKPYKPKPHQQKALKEANEHFLKQKNNKGKLVFPCGAGKSLTGYWIKQELNAQSTIVAVPSLSLVKQTLEVYLRESVANKQKIEWLCVCSDEGIGKNDDVVVHTNEIGVPCITDKNFIADWIKKNKNNRTVIFTTYQSGKTIAEAAKIAKAKFDLGIMDEAHKTVGNQDKLFSYLLFDKNIKIDKRIFMTATERRYAGSSENILSMDDVEVYGETFTQMPFKDAINQDILSDYKIITLFISDKEVKDIIEKNAFVKPNGKVWDKETEARTLASMVALRKAMNQFPIHHAVTFHSSIKKAEAFEQSQTLFSKAFPQFKKIASYHVSGAMPTSQRSKIVNEFAASNKAIITNAKCLTEGVDVPNIDCVLFADPRKSTVDIVQAVGRALRKKEGKQFGYVILPVFTKSKTKEEIIESVEFKEILSTLRALASNDERIIEYFRDISKKEKSHSSNSGLVQFDIDENIIERISEKDLIGSLQLKTWDKLAKLSWMPFEEAREYVRKLVLKNNDDWRAFSKSNIKPLDIPTAPDRIYKNDGWLSWGDFLGTGNVANYYKEYLSFEKAKKYIQELNIKSGSGFKILHKEKKIPDNIPASPDIVYKKYGWKSWGDFLGSKFVATNLRIYVSYSEASEYAKKINIKSSTEWKSFVNSKIKPDNIPKQPYKVYANSGWKDWSTFLGVYKEPYLEFLEAKSLVLEKNINTIHQFWIKYRSGELPLIPKNPAIIYKNKGWIDWQDFLSIKNKNASKYLPYLEVKLLAQKNKISTVKEWRSFLKKTIEKGGVPSHPNIVYKGKGWISWADFFGTENFREIAYLPFEEAREIVRREQINNNKQWRQYSKERRPNNSPGDPSKVYIKSGWLNWADFLGNNNFYKIDYLSFEEARKFVREKGLKSYSEWKVFAKNDKQINIPTSADVFYKNSGWKGWGDFLGNGIIANQEKSFLQIEDAKNVVKEFKLSSTKEWQEFCRKGKKPNNIPRNPYQYYSGKGWKSWTDFLSVTKSEKVLNKKYLDFVSAKTFIRTLKINTQDLWKQYCKSGKKQENIPFNPNSVYKEFGWEGWGDWLGTGRQATKNRKYWDYEKTKKFVNKLNLKNEKEWRLYTKSNLMPDSIPVAPHSVYKEEWKGMGDWLGTGNIAPHKRDFMSYDEAKIFVSKLNLKNQNDWRTFCKSNNRPDNLPTNPQKTYLNSGWISYGEFLGTGTIAPGKQVYLDFREAKKFVQKLKLQSRTEWEKYYKIGDKPLNIPSSPNYIYKNKGWKGWADFLGKAEISENKK